MNRDLEIPISAYVAIGLIDAGTRDGHRLAGCPTWFRERQRDGMAEVTGAPAGGWGWAWPSGWPNTGDTTATMLALHRFGLPPEHPAQLAGTDWLLRMQNRDGSWSCFSRNVKLSLDAPCTVMTADAVSTLHDAAGLPPEHPAIGRAVDWFAANQNPDGSLACRWYLGPDRAPPGKTERVVVLRWQVELPLLRPVRAAVPYRDRRIDSSATAILQQHADLTSRPD